MSGQRESKPLSTFRKFARFLRKVAAVSALSAFAENRRLARFAQNYHRRLLATTGLATQRFGFGPASDGAGMTIA